MDEFLDIVDKNDKVIGYALRSEIYAQKLSYFRVVNAFLINQHGQLWIPRRTKNKCIFPLCLDASMGGHVLRGEDYEQAFRRELLEELRIDLQKVSYEILGYLTPYQHNTSAFMYVYLLRTNDVPYYNPDDFFEYFWLTPQELLDRIACRDCYKEDLLHIVKCFYQKLCY